MSAGESIAVTLDQELGIEVSAIRPIAGGDINDAFQADTNDGTLFVKTRAGAPAGSFAEEAAGLRWLGEPGAIAVPEVVLVHDPPGDVGHAGAAPRFLALEWIDRGVLTPNGEAALGRGLAAVHAAGAPAFGATPARSDDLEGVDRDASPADETAPAPPPTRLADLTLPNDPCETFAEFYALRRIVPLAEAAYRRGRLTDVSLSLMYRLVERMPEIAGPSEPPARTHGDLWSGNVLAGVGGEPYLIDPVAHGGHREVDLATLRIFGGPGRRCFGAYAEAFPLADGHAERVPLFQLNTILIHVALFGGSYEQQAVAIARRYL